MKRALWSLVVAGACVGCIDKSSPPDDDTELIKYAEPPRKPVGPPSECARVDPCEVGTPTAPRPGGPDPEVLLSTDGERVFYRTQTTDFDAASFHYASAPGCATWQDVYAWDSLDVYLLSPQSCGGDNCGGDHTGYYWRPLGVAHPERFRWLAAGYATDGEHVYHRFEHGPIESAEPEQFEVLTCGDSDEVLGFSESVGQAPLWLRDGQPFTPS